MPQFFVRPFSQPPRKTRGHVGAAGLPGYTFPASANVLRALSGDKPKKEEDKAQRKKRMTQKILFIYGIISCILKVNNTQHAVQCTALRDCPAQTDTPCLPPFGKRGGLSFRSAAAYTRGRGKQRLPSQQAAMGLARLHLRTMLSCVGLTSGKRDDGSEQRTNEWGTKR